MPNTEKLELINSVRKHILGNPQIAYADLISDSKFSRLTTVQFYNIKAGLRKKGLLVGKAESKSKSERRFAPTEFVPDPKSKCIEILETIDFSNISEEIKQHYKTGILTLLQRIVPDGKNIRMVFLSDPPALEIRRLAS